jgi:hypothetical protein
VQHPNFEITAHTFPAFLQPEGRNVDYKLIVKAAEAANLQIEASGVDSHNNDGARRCIGAREADGDFIALQEISSRLMTPTRKLPLMDHRQLEHHADQTSSW